MRGVDVNPDVVKTVNEGKIHITEPDLEGLVKYNVEKGYLRADTKPTEADVFIIAVPTPFKERYKPDISYVESAVNMILPYLKVGNLIVIESTIPVGTTEELAKILFTRRDELKDKVYIAYCPERVLPGRILYEIEHNDRVIGGLDDKSTDKAKEFYALFVKGRLYGTDTKTAEMCKLVENAYRDVNIAFANELSMICDEAKINVWELIELANKHPRVNILSPGVGVGGHCIAVDPWFIISSFKEKAKLIEMARKVNRDKTEWVVNKIKEEIEKFKRKQKREPVIACMGLTYKPDIDDLRESPALKITYQLMQEGFRILAVEPHIDGLEKIKLVDYRKAIEKADIIVFMVKHRKFMDLKVDSQKLVIDFCGILENGRDKN